MSLKRMFRKINRKTVVTLSLIVVIFVMSLGYAALSQYMEIEGVALIDRNWIIKITNVTSSVSSSGVNNSSPYVGSTVTMNATIPNASSKVTYTITLKNEGNLRAKLHSIEQIEDKNTSITYTISGVEAGVTELNPGETNTVTVTIQAASGVSNISNTSKSVMLSFYYVENTVDNSGGNTSGETYPSYSVGDYVMLVDGTRGVVTKDSGINEEFVTILLERSFGKFAFDTTGSTVYDPTSSTNVGQQIQGVFLGDFKWDIEDAGGDSTGISARLITREEMENAVNLGTTLRPYFYPEFEFWTMTATDANTGMWASYGGNDSGFVWDSADYAYYDIVPVVIIKKSNVVSLAGTLVQKILSDNSVQSDMNIDFSQISSDTNGKGLYVTNDNTTHGWFTYYFRGAVTNNYVSFAGQTWRIVRINEDGSVRLINQNGIGNIFNSSADDNTYVGYMIGSASASSYLDTHSNATDSTAKALLDDWYEDNLASYEEYFATNTGFCNDRSVYTGTGIAKTTTYYRAHRRISSLKQPQFKCPQSSDFFTTEDYYGSSSSGDGGNKKLTYPIGMITADEVMYAGVTISENNSSVYLNNGSALITMTPYYFSSTAAYTWNVTTNSKFYTSRNVAYSISSAIRPVINVKGDVLIELNGTGDPGTSTNPYIIKTN